ncbi:hypothetical protein F5X99DRAFT_56619 [Biscogniauxia marginata]|nr:hypothetical protein F5X99DRAFT_56619 [Biscogniauxia marginata]
MAGTREPLAGYGRGSCFSLFYHLPVELRLTIWDLNLPWSRIVPVRCGAHPAFISPDEPWGWDSQLVQCTSSSPVPVNLHVCRESRIEAMKRYKLMFGTKRDPGRIFFDPLRDTLYFGARDGDAATEAQFDAFTKLVSYRNMSLVRHVAINEALIRGIDDVAWNETPAGTITVIASTSPSSSSVPGLTIIQVLRRVGSCFRNLEQLTFVCNDRNPVYSADSVFVEPGQRNRLVERRICDAVQTIEDQWPDLTTPRWNIRAIAADPDPPAYDRRILGYGRPGPSSFGHFQKRKRSWLGSQCACNSCGQQQKQEDSSGRELKLSSSALGWYPCRSSSPTPSLLSPVTIV